MIKKTVGGDRLGSGNRMKAELHNYERSTHNLGNGWRSSMAPGTLVPCFKKLCQNGDTWEIDTMSLVRTMPAIGPLFGTYKLQIDFFECPIRLYNGILHNNMTKIGMDMSKVKLPKIQIQTKWLNPETYIVPNRNTSQVSSSSLLAYLGQRGIAEGMPENRNNEETITRKINAVPILAYYDIFKNYYSNKQEEHAYVINETRTNETLSQLENASAKYKTVDGYKWQKIESFPTEAEVNQQEFDKLEFYIKSPNGDVNTTNSTYWYDANGFQVMTRANSLNKNDLKVEATGAIGKNLYLEIVKWNEDDEVISGVNYMDNNWFTVETDYNSNEFKIKNINIEGFLDATHFSNDMYNIYVRGILYNHTATYEKKTEMKSFRLDNIDEMRIRILQNTALGTEFIINETGLYPYRSLFDVSADGKANCVGKLSGLVVKTYQSDIFNNWLSTNWIDGINGINTISAVAIENNSFTIDALNLAHKVYNMLNRIAISGGTYEDWQEAVYGEDALRRAESPIYCGGMSGEIAFEEVVSTADTQTPEAGSQPLGTLGGKGILTNVKGGNIDIHVKEPSYIIGIVSITPRLDYCQGNDFDMTELDSLDDLHKPELDEIGFQDLLLERAAWWATRWDSQNERWVRPAGGKLPAWIEYMTSVNQVYGDFAEKSELGYMVLTRDYEYGNANYDGTTMPGQGAPTMRLPIKDWTTYINPTKFNYQFANTKIDAQNFWVQILINATSRRKISAKLIPNL